AVARATAGGAPTAVTPSAKLVAADPPSVVPSATTPPTATNPPATALPTTTPVPPAIADWNALQSKLDGGLWDKDQAGAAAEPERYWARYGTVDGPQPAQAREKLYAASINLGQQAVGASDFAAAQKRYSRALELHANDPVAGGQLKKLDLLLAGIELTNKQN